MTDWLIHGLLGNNAAEGQVGLTRGLVAAAIMEIVGLIIYCLPLSAETVAYISTHIAAAVTLVSFVAYAYLDYVLKKIGRK